MKTLGNFDRERLVGALRECVGYVKYELGAKPPLTAVPGEFRYSDCSGFVRWLIRYCTHGAAVIPDGSQNQFAWARESGFKMTEFDNCKLTDDRLRICFMRPPRAGKPGHVWLCLNGMTIESYGGHGVGRRKWSTLRKRKPSAYVLTGPLS